MRVAGWGGTATEKARAENDARGASPRRVDGSELRVDRGIDDGTLRGRPPIARSDGDLGQALLDAYVRDPRVHPFLPSVDVHDGVIILTGIAPNPFAALAAGDDARNVIGVVEVYDKMKTTEAAVATNDGAVVREIRDGITRDARLSTLSVEVDVQNGRVFLRGTVPSDADRLELEYTLAASAEWARDVEDGLVLVPRLGVTTKQPE